ncbi:MAG: AraC family transcriptional regulator [Polyangiaceae bacterium]
MQPRLPKANETWEASLHELRLTGTLYCRATLTGPWGIAIPDLSEVMMFGVLTEGEAWLERSGRPPERLGPGSSWLLPRGAAHRIYSGPGATCVPLEALPVEPVSPRYELLHYGGGGPTTQATYGLLRFDDAAAERLVASLPDLIHVDSRRSDTEAWLGGTIELIAQEARHLAVGGAAVLTRLADVIVIQLIRAWLQEHRDHDGWLAALRDERLGRALRAIHERPGEPWTLDRLAKEAGMSRSSFATQFADEVGEPAMAYLSAHRMATARARLRDGEAPLAAIATEVGYQSEAAFGRAFKRATGVAPGRYRRDARRGGPS